MDVRSSRSNKRNTRPAEAPKRATSFKLFGKGKTTKPSAPTKAKSVSSLKSSSTPVTASATPPKANPTNQAGLQKAAEALVMSVLEKPPNGNNLEVSLRDVQGKYERTLAQKQTLYQRWQTVQQEARSAQHQYALKEKLWQRERKELVQEHEAALEQAAAAAATAVVPEPAPPAAEPQDDVLHMLEERLQGLQQANLEQQQDYAQQLQVLQTKLDIQALEVQIAQAQVQEWQKKKQADPSAAVRSEANSKQVQDLQRQLQEQSQQQQHREEQSLQELEALRRSHGALVTDKDQEIRALQQQLADAQEQRQSERVELESLRASVAPPPDQEETDRLRRELLETQAFLGELRDKSKAKETQVLSLKEKIRFLEEDLSVTQLTETETLLVEQQRELLSERDVTIQELQHQIRDQWQLEEIFEDLQQRLERREAEMKEHETQSTSKDERIAHLEQQVLQFQSQDKVAGTDSVELQKVQAALHQQVHATEEKARRLVELEAALDEQVHATEEKARRLVELEAEICSVKAASEELRVELQAAESSSEEYKLICAKHDAKVRDLELQLSQNDETPEDHTKEIESLQTSLEQQKVALTEAQNSLEEKDRVIAGLKAQVSEAEENLAISNHEQAIIESKWNALSAILSEKEQIISEKESELEKVVEQLDHSSSELDDAREASLVFDSELARMKRLIDSNAVTEKQLKKAQQKLKEKDRVISDLKDQLDRSSDAEDATIDSSFVQGDVQQLQKKLESTEFLLRDREMESMSKDERINELEAELELVKGDELEKTVTMNAATKDVKELEEMILHRDLEAAERDSKMESMKKEIKLLRSGSQLPRSGSVRSMSSKSSVGELDDLRAQIREMRADIKAKDISLSEKSTIISNQERTVLSLKQKIKSEGADDGSDSSSSSSNSDESNGGKGVSKLEGLRLRRREQEMAVRERVQRISSARSADKIDASSEDRLKELQAAELELMKEVDVERSELQLQLRLDPSLVLKEKNEQLKQTRQKIVDLVERNKSAQLELIELGKQKREFDERKARASSKVLALEEKLEQAKALIASMEEAYGTCQSASNELIGVMDGDECVNLENEVKRLEQELEECTEQIQLLAKLKEERYRSPDSAQAAKLRAQVQDLRTKVSTANGHLAQIQSLTQKTDKDLEDLRSEVAEKQNEERELEEECQILREEFERSGQMIESLVEDGKETNEKLADLRAELKDLERRNRKLVAEKEKVEANLQQANAHIETLEKTLDNAADEYESIQEELANQEKENEMFQPMLDNAKEQLLNACGKVEELVTEGDSAKAEIQTLMATLKHRQNGGNPVSFEIRELRSEMQELYDLITNTTVYYDSLRGHQASTADNNGSFSNNSTSNAEDFPVDVAWSREASTHSRSVRSTHSRTPSRSDGI